MRSLLFSAILVAGILFVSIYVLLSIPPVQSVISKIAAREASAFLKSRVTVDHIDISPFNEVVLHDVNVYTPRDERCILIKRLGAGINLYKLITTGRIEITYAELIGLDGAIWQRNEGEPLNIDFIIKAFAPRKKNRETKNFDLAIYNIVIRRGTLSYDKLWIPPLPDSTRIDFNHLKITDLKADLVLPHISPYDFNISLRRLAMREISGLDVEKLAFDVHLTSDSLTLKSFMLNLPNTELTVGDLGIGLSAPGKIIEGLIQGNHLFDIRANINPGDVAPFYPVLGTIHSDVDLNLKATGNLDYLKIESVELSVDRSNSRMAYLEARGNVSHILNPKELGGELADIRCYLNNGAQEIIKEIVPKFSDKAEMITSNMLPATISGSGSYDNAVSKGAASVLVESGDCFVDFYATYLNRHLTGSLTVDNLDMNNILPSSGLGPVSLKSDINLRVEPHNLSGDANVAIASAVFKGTEISDINLTVSKQDREFVASVAVDDDSVGLLCDVDALINGPSSSYALDLTLSHFYPGNFGLMPKLNGYNVSGLLSADLQGSNIDNITGSLSLSALKLRHISKESLEIAEFTANIVPDNECRNVYIDSDLGQIALTGLGRISDISSHISSILSKSMPALFNYPKKIKPGLHEADLPETHLEAVLYPARKFYDFMDINFRPYENVRITGSIYHDTDNFNLDVNAPYLLQGKKKLIKHAQFSVRGDGPSGSSALHLSADYPIKSGYVSLLIDGGVIDNDVKTTLLWAMPDTLGASGRLDLNVLMNRNEDKKGLAFRIYGEPSHFYLNSALWRIEPINILYSDKLLDVRRLHISHDDQFVDVAGRITNEPDTELKINLEDIDLSYIFNTLNIENVNFGGHASGVAVAGALFSGIPDLRTERLSVRNFSYNNALLGDGALKGYWVPESKKIGIYADITSRKGYRTIADGGVYLGCDSLGFDFQADHVNIAFLQPFLSAITSQVEGEASGHAHLFGTFKNINLEGNVFVDSIAVKVDQTNVIYAGADSVIMRPGSIRFPSFKLHDKFGNSAVLRGDVTHNCFHNAVFDFRVNEARNLLVFDISAQQNPDWYGTIFGSGGGRIWGRPGYAAVMMDMITAPGSTFTFVLSDIQTATDYTFLSFSDRRKAESMTQIEIDMDPEERFRRSQLNPVTEDLPSVFQLDLRASVTPEARMNLIMDPEAGDKITAHGTGNLQLGYDTESDEITLYGKYTLTEGNYNFSLQDLILKDFTIRPGSSIAFDGDPLGAILDITAAYRVNTNLSDLDKSFSSDRDLNRTNVPVDALMKVTGDLNAPDIQFDISLPTLTSDVESKVRSIISTEDMLNRQIIYLLALNRFYTPEYMTTSGSGGELASVASSTISSQLQNAITRLTDKVTVAPSFRSDKGDFSDMEVDVALSSRLLNNRLLINGNFGYRDRSTSTTTFVGDFDVEYLLNKSGDLRLKAYNHFNDQNYYFKSSLTTQGIGVLYRHDFNNPFTWLRRRRKPVKTTGSGSGSDVIINNKSDK